MRNRTLRKNRVYDSVVEVLNSYKYKELTNYFLVIGLCNHFGANIFENENIKPYMTEIKQLLDKFEVERKINYKQFREGVSETISKYTKKESHLKLIELGVKLFNIKDADEAIDIGNWIFSVEATRTIFNKGKKSVK